MLECFPYSLPEAEMNEMRGGGALFPPKNFENEKFGQKQWEIRAKTMGNSGKIRKFGQKQWEIRAKAIPGGGGPLDYLAVHTRDQENA